MSEQILERNVGRPSGVKASVPKDAARVAEIIRRRDAGESFVTIGESFGISRMGAYQLYHRWKDSK